MGEVIVVVGAGHAAVRDALAMRKAGYADSIVMIAREGVKLPYERPPLSKWSGHEPPVQKPVVPHEQLNDGQIERVALILTQP